MGQCGLGATALNLEQPFEPPMVRRYLAALLLALCIGVLNPSPAGALVLEMQIEVAPGDQAKLEVSIDAIDSFFRQQSGFIRASLDPSGVAEYNLEEEWQSLADYKNAIDQADFKALADAVPGSSNWTASSLFP